MRASIGFLLVSALSLPAACDRAKLKKRLTGADLDTNTRWNVAGTDLGIPYLLENNKSIGYLFGDTFGTALPEEGKNWRSPVMLRSAVSPDDDIVFDSAAGVAGDNPAPEVMHNGHNGDDGGGTFEVSAIPNDAVSFPETGQQILSYMSVREWSSPWKTSYAGLAISEDGNTFKRLAQASIWPNDAGNADPFQMCTMQRDGDYVYVFSVRAGRQEGPMMLRRVHWKSIIERDAYEGWGWNGSDWAWGREPTAILEGNFGEPSVRKLQDGTWVMVYLDLNGGTIVSRTAKGPDQEWSDPVVQIEAATAQNFYGGFIHPWSTKEALHMMVSQWRKGDNGVTNAYHVNHYVGSL